jgi:hypothetical protein
LNPFFYQWRNITKIKRPMIEYYTKWNYFPGTICALLIIGFSCKAPIPIVIICGDIRSIRTGNPFVPRMSDPRFEIVISKSSLQRRDSFGVLLSVSLSRTGGSTESDRPGNPGRGDDAEAAPGKHKKSRAENSDAGHRINF